MINSESTINDGLDLDTCENNGGTVSLLQFSSQTRAD